ncbi:MAG: hypothetical protein V4451_08865 [Pseudomonadota bacterium]
MAIDTSYQHLTYRPTLRAKIDHRIRKILGAVFCRFYPAKLALRVAEKGTLAIRNCTVNYEPLIAQAKIAAGASPNSFGSAFGYEDDSVELDAVMYYRSQLKDPNFENIPSESAVLYKHVLDAFEGLLRKDSSIKNMLDFGVSYAHVDSVLVQRHPSLRIIGCDRSELTMAINRVDFGKIPNLVLHGGDVFECLEQYGPIDVLFHMRTACLLPADFMNELYAKARAKGARYVVLAEQMGLSWETDAGYEFSEDEQKSVLLRWKMWIHNYPALLKKAGFKVESSETFGTKHANPNLKFLLIVAKVV